jgi:hypothetical protein
MMGWIRLALFSLVAAAFATAVGTMLGAMLSLFVVAVANGLNVFEALIGLLVLAPFTLMFSMGFVWDLLQLVAPVAAALGGSLWALGRSRPRLRSRWTWCAAGALFGALLYAAMKLGFVPGATEYLEFIYPAQAALTAVSGVGAALAFRAAMRLLTEFFAPGEADEQG